MKPGQGDGLEEVGGHMRPVFYRPGIYAITCIVDKRTYVGQSKNISKRWATHRHEMNAAREHFLVKPYTSLDILWHSWNVYGPDMHRFSVLEPVDEWLIPLSQVAPYVV
jgi:GIY-YIG catalytic domain